jgi:hypothetical protein
LLRDTYRAGTIKFKSRNPRFKWEQEFRIRRKNPRMLFKTKVESEDPDATLPVLPDAVKIEPNENGVYVNIKVEEEDEALVEGEEDDVLFAHASDGVYTRFFDLPQYLRTGILFQGILGDSVQVASPPTRIVREAARRNAQDLRDTPNNLAYFPQYIDTKHNHITVIRLPGMHSAPARDSTLVNSKRRRPLQSEDALQSHPTLRDGTRSRVHMF